MSSSDIMTQYSLDKAAQQLGYPSNSAMEVFRGDKESNLNILKAKSDAESKSISAKTAAQKMHMDGQLNGVKLQAERSKLEQANKDAEEKRNEGRFKANLENNKLAHMARMDTRRQNLLEQQHQASMLKDNAAHMREQDKQMQSKDMEMRKLLSSHKLGEAKLQIDKKKAEQPPKPAKLGKS